MLSPGGASGVAMGDGSTRSPLVPSEPGFYTFVSIGAGGTTVYVAGLPWATFPGVAWGDLPPAAPGASQTAPVSLRFFGGNLASRWVAIADLQVYDHAMSAGAIAGLSRGVSFVC